MCRIWCPSSFLYEYEVSDLSPNCCVCQCTVSPTLSFPDLVDSKIITLQELSDHRMEFVVTSDPSLDTQSGHLLSRQGGSPCENRVYIQGTTVHLKKVRRSDAGMYTVSSFNAVGKGQASFQLKIKCEWRFLFFKGVIRIVLCYFP